MMSFMAGVGSPNVTRLSVWSIGCSVVELRQPALLDQCELREAHGGRFLRGDLNELHRRLHVDDVWSF